MINNHWKAKYYPWVICFSALLILVIINGLTTTSLSVFDKALLKEFGWQRGELKLRESITNAVTLFFILLSGIIIDKIRVKKMLLAGTIALSIALMGYSFITTKSQAYCIHFLLGISMVCAGSVSCIILVSSWFKTQRGLALGIVLTGTSLGSAIFSPLNVYLIQRYGWRHTFALLSILPILLFIYILLVVKNSPEEIAPKHTTASSSQDLLTQGMTYQQATHTHVFWLICICGFFTFYSLVGTIANTFLHLTGLNYTDKEASLYLGMYFIIAGISKLLISAFLDYINPYLMFSFCCFLMIVGCLGLSSMNTDFILLSIIIMAISWGGIYSLYNLIAIKTFGLASAGKINGTINMFESAGALLGPFTTGFIFSIYHSYQFAFILNAVLMIFVLLFSLKFKGYVHKLTNQS